MLKSVPQLLNEFTILISAGVLGYLAFSRMNRFQRIMFIQLIVWFLFYVFSHVVLYVQKAAGEPLNNQWLFNISLLVEGSIVFYAVFNFPVAILNRTFIWIMYFAFVLLWIYQVARQGFFTYAYYADTASCFIFAFLFFIGIYRFLSKDVIWWKTPETYICSGLLLYYTCSIPYVTAFDYLVKNNPVVSRILFFAVNDVLANVRYGCLAISYWIIYKNIHE